MHEQRSENRLPHPSRRASAPAPKDRLGATLAFAAALLLSACAPADEGREGRPHAAPEASPTKETTMPRLDADAAERFAGLALACIDRPWPYKTGHVLTGEDALRPPREVHPVFYGCFDWHSAVHGHWMLVRLLRVMPDHPLREASRRALDARLTREAFEREAAYFEEPQTASFERPYGWAWLLQLAAELDAFAAEGDEDAARWRDAIRPLESAIATRLSSYIGKLTWPIRTGVHPNTAFALGLGLDYARRVGDQALAERIASRARDYYIEDRDAPLAYEPSGEDFFSPALLEADLMRRVLDEDEFRSFLGRFMPTLSEGGLGGLTEPARVSDRSDPKIVHLDGLNLVRAWTMANVAAALPAGDPRRARLEELAAAHARAGLERIASGHYEGEHWLASFAVYMLSGSGRPSAAY